MQNQSKCKVTERLSLPELKTDVLQILHARGAIQVEHADRTGEGIRVEGIYTSRSFICVGMMQNHMEAGRE